MNICGRSSLPLIPDARYAPSSIFSIDVYSSIGAALNVDGVEPTASRPSYAHVSRPNLSLVTGVQFSEPSTAKKSGRPSLSLTPDTQHVPPLSSGIHFNCWFGRLSFFWYPKPNMPNGLLLSLTTGTQRASSSSTIRHVDDSPDSTLAVGGVPPFAHTHPRAFR